jgi:hypothetical protein
VADLLWKELEELKLSLDGEDLDDMAYMPTIDRKLRFARRVVEQNKRTEEAKKRTEEANKRTEEVKKRTEEAKKRTEEAKKRADYARFPNTFTTGYPALGVRRSNCTSTNKSNYHAPVEVVPLDGKDSFSIGELKGELNEVRRLVYRTTDKEETLPYGEESDLQDYICSGFKEATEFAELSHTAWFRTNYSLPYKHMENEWKKTWGLDIAGLTVLQNNEEIMILCTEVKTPYDAIPQDYEQLFKCGGPLVPLNYYLGQLYDYHFYYGVKQPYGILHFYTHYIVIVPAFLPCAEEMIAEIGLDHKPSNYKELEIKKGDFYEALENPCSPITLIGGTPATKNQSFTSNRKVYISELVECIGEKSAAEKLANIIFVSTQSDVEMGSLKDTQMFAELHEDSPQWQLLPPNIQIRLDRFLEEANWKSSCFQLAFLGSGRDGKCCLACDGEGRTCVLKFFNDCNTSAADEAKRWNEIWGIDAWTTKLLGENALVMPFARTLTETEVRGHESEIWEGVIKSGGDEGNRKINFPISKINFVDLGCLIRQAIKDMAAKRFVHNDLYSEDGLRWHHVGLIELEGEWKCIFIDLSDMRDDVDPKAAEKEMLNIFASGCGHGDSRMLPLSNP